MMSSTVNTLLQTCIKNSWKCWACTKI